MSISSSDEEVQLEILRNLYNNHRASPFYQFYFKVNTPPNVDLNTLQFNLRYLKEKGFIEMGGEGAKITVEGIDFLNKNEKEKKENSNQVSSIDVAILKFLNENEGYRLDAEISKQTKISLSEIKSRIRMNRPLRTGGYIESQDNIPTDSIRSRITSTGRIYFESLQVKKSSQNEGKNEKRRKPISPKIKKELMTIPRKYMWCRKQPSQELHHIDENPSNNDISNLIPLCGTCHNRVTAKEITKEQLLRRKGMKEPRSVSFLMRMKI